MHWMFIVDLAFYAVLGIMTFPLLVLIIALFTGRTFDDAYQGLKAFLAKWAAIQPKDFVDKTLKVSGTSGVVFLLAFGAYVSNRIGDGALPYSSAAFAYFGNNAVRWTVEYDGEWKNLKSKFRTVTEIEHDRDKWEQAKAQMGQYDVRFFRTLAVYGVILSFSAAFAMFRNATLVRGVILASALLAVGVSHALWGEREQQFIENLVARYVSECRKQNPGANPAPPANYRGWWPEGHVGCESRSEAIQAGGRTQP